MKKVIELIQKQIKSISRYSKLKVDYANIVKSDKAKSHQISLMNKRLSMKNEDLIRLNESLLYMSVEQDKKDEVISLLQEQSVKSQVNWENSEIERERITEYANRLMTNNSLIVQKLFTSLNKDTFSVLAARKIDLKPFDSAKWEVLFIDKGDLKTVVIERYVHEDLLNVMRIVETAKSVDEVMTNSLSQSSLTNRGVL
ncbi:hypothetical protein ACMGD3_24325 [Lysinibacillus sphaericus]|uniref:hypothetical protein n=1 Tax=Lysinibacillus sphaericus TaxID=1421 RepID=UPI003F7A5593